MISEDHQALLAIREILESQWTLESVQKIAKILESVGLIVDLPK